MELKEVYNYTQSIKKVNEKLLEAREGIFGLKSKVISDMPRSASFGNNQIDDKLVIIEELKEEKNDLILLRAVKWDKAKAKMESSGLFTENEILLAEYRCLKGFDFAECGQIMQTKGVFCTQTQIAEKLKAISEKYSKIA